MTHLRVFGVDAYLNRSQLLNSLIGLQRVDSYFYRKIANFSKMMYWTPFLQKT